MSLFESASLVVTPNGTKASKLYSVKPTDGSGDMTVARATTATRVNSSGLIESVATNVPRLDYTNSTCPSILIEPQRTNLLVNTIWAGGGSVPTSWIKQFTGNTSPIASITNPNVIAYNFNGVATRGFFSQPQTLTTNTTYAFSIYVESVNIANPVGHMLLIANGNGTTTYLKNNISILSTENIAAGNTYTLIFSATATTTISEIRIGLGAGSGTPTGNFTLSMPQLEVGAYATSYIPTIASTVTRNADVISRNNIYTNGLITSAGGTWFVELNNNIPYTRDTASSGFYLSDIINPNIGSGSIGNLFTILKSSVNGDRLQISKQTNLIYTSLYVTLTTIVRIAIKWNGTTADVFVNGVKVVSATSFAFTNMQFLNSNNTDVPKYIKSTLLFPTPLSDSECIAMTQL